MNFNTQGVLVSLFDDSFSMKLQGQVSEINLLLQNKLIIANFTYISDIKIKVFLNDNINYDFSNNFQADKIAFIKPNKKVSKTFSIESQFFSKYTKGTISIEEEMQF